MVEKNFPGGRQHNSTRLSLQQLHTNLSLKITDLSAQGRLRGVEPLLCRGKDTAALGDGHEIAEMSEFQGKHPYAFKA